MISGNITKFTAIAASAQKMFHGGGPGIVHLWTMLRILMSLDNLMPTTTRAVRSDNQG